MYDLKPGQLIECEWVDPAAASDWKPGAEVTGFWRFLCHSVGFVHALDSGGLVLTACYGVDPEGDRSLLLRQHLPWNCIIDLWLIEVENGG